MDKMSLHNKEYDSLTSKEYNHFTEHKKFKAEDFKTSEVVKALEEAYKSEEVKKVSFVESIKNKKGKNNNKSSKLKPNNKLTSSISTPLGSVGSLVSVAVVGATVVLAPVLGIDIGNNPNEYGSFDITKCKIDKEIDENDVIINDIYLYYDLSKFNNGYTPKLINPIKESNNLIELTNNYFLINNIKDGEFDLKIEIYNDKTSSLIDTISFNVDTTSSLSFINEEQAQKYLLTYNLDNTSNIYYQKTDVGLEENILKREIILEDENKKLLNYKVNEIDSSTDEISDINEQKYQINEKIYHKVDKFEYLIYQTQTKLFEINKADVLLETTQSKCSFTINDKIASDINVRVNFNDLDKVSSYVIKKEDYKDNYTINFEQVSTDVDIKIEYSKAHYSTIIEPEFNFKGEISKKVSTRENFKFSLVSEVIIKDIEFITSNNSYSDIATIYLDGYLLPNEYAAIEIKNENNDVVYSHGYIKDLPTTIEVSSIPTNTDLTIEYLTYYEETPHPDVDLEGTQEHPFYESYAVITSSNIKNINFETNEEYDSLYSSNSITFDIVDAYKYYLTANEDGSMNAYTDVNLINNSSYEVYLKTSLSPSYIEMPSLTNYSNDGYVIFEDFGKYEDSEGLQYLVNYELVIFESNYKYKISSTEYGNGYIGTIYNNQYFMGYDLYSYSTDTEFIYQIETYYEITSNASISLILDYSTEIDPYIILYEDISDPKNGIIEVDLTSYSTYSSIEVIIEATINLNSLIEDVSFINSMNIKGSSTVNARGSAFIYNY